MTLGQSWPNNIGSKKGNLQACLTNPVFTRFPLKVAWSGISLIMYAPSGGGGGGGGGSQVSYTTRKKLQVLQNKALRCALSKEKLFPTDELHVEAKLLKLKDRRHMHVLLHMYQLAGSPNAKFQTVENASTKRG